MAINLTKADDTATISLKKGGSDNLVVRAQWVDNGDGKDNDDLDLRCSILMPDGAAYYVDGHYRGDLDGLPYAHHHGDVQTVDASAPAEEIITVARDIATRCGGNVALAFSVYSAVGNGQVSVASLQPKMLMRCGDEEVICQYDFQQDANSRRSDVYSYVIGYAIVTPDSVVLAPSGKTSRPGGEETPWLSWHGDDLDLQMSGPAVMKGQDKAAERYNKSAGISHRFANVGGGKSGGKGLFSKLLG